MPELQIVDQSGLLSLENEPHFRLAANLSLIGHHVVILTLDEPVGDGLENDILALAGRSFPDWLDGTTGSWAKDILIIAVAPRQSTSAVLYGEKWRAAMDTQVAKITADLDRQVGQGKIASGILQAESDIRYTSDAWWAAQTPQQASAADTTRKSQTQQALLHWVLYPLLALIFAGIGATWDARRKDRENHRTDSTSRNVGGRLVGGRGFDRSSGFDDGAGFDDGGD